MTTLCRESLGPSRSSGTLSGAQKQQYNPTAGEKRGRHGHRCWYAAVSRGLGGPLPRVMASFYFLSRLKPRWWWQWGEETPRWLRRHCPILVEWGLKLTWTRDWRAKKLGFLCTFVCRRSSASCVSATLKLTNSPPVRAPAWEGGAFVSRAIISPAVPAAYQRPTSKGELCTEHYGSGRFPTAEVNAVQTSTHSNQSCKAGRQISEKQRAWPVRWLTRHLPQLPLNGMDSLPCPA